MSTTVLPSAGATQVDKDRHRESSRRFRFKRGKEGHIDRDTNKGGHERSHRERHHRHHRKKRRRGSDHGKEHSLPHEHSTSELPPDIAFRESLFDALGDDEGAAFWQGVYGQPIHEYPNARTNSETGELEQMNDEEYAQYVRRRMWERSREGIEAAREAQRKQRHEEKQQKQKEERARSAEPSQSQKDHFVFDFEVEASLRRGERRKEQRYWRTLWKQYLQDWEDLTTLQETRKGQAEHAEQLTPEDKMPWPVESGGRKHVVSEEIERFMKNVAANLDSDGDFSLRLAALLKVERVKWHPDKILQRFGFMANDPATMEGVTAVFQVLDRMWNEVRQQKP